MCGLPGTGKTKIAKLLSETLTIHPFLEPEEVDYDEILKTSLKLNNMYSLEVYLEFRKLRMDNIKKAVHYKKNGESSILDSVIDPIMYYYSQCPGSQWILPNNATYRDDIIKISEFDVNNFPKIDLIVFLFAEKDFHKALVNKRERSFEPDFKHYDTGSLLNSVFQYCSMKNIPFLAIEQDGSPQDTVNKIMNRIMENKFCGDITLDDGMRCSNKRNEVVPIENVYKLLREGNDIPTRIIDEMKKVESNIYPYQFASLAGFLLFKKKSRIQLSVLTEDEDDFYVWIKVKYPEVASYLDVIENSEINGIFSNSLNSSCSSCRRFCDILSKVFLNEELALGNIEFLVKNFVNKEISDVAMTLWLVFVFHCGLSQSDINILTKQSALSGDIFDYRNNPEFVDHNFIRRYPSGGTSDKVAVIMSALAASFVKVEQKKIILPYLMAFSLGTTGGSYDRFKCIPGFEAPHQGPSTISFLKKHGVSLSIAGNNFNEFDKKTYLLRSATGTVKSYSLMVASIASKHLALPVKHLFMDYRYGEGTNINTEADAKRLAEGIKEAVKSEMTCDYIIYDNKEPTGMSLGPLMEMIESIAVMKYDTLGGFFDKSRIDIQVEIINHQFSLMMEKVCDDEKSLEEWIEICREKFKSQLVIEAFKNCLPDYGVPEDIVESIIENPLLLLSGFIPFDIKSDCDGFLKKIMQDELGSFINFEFSVGTNKYLGGGVNQNGAGLVLKKKLNDEVNINDVLCVIYARKEYLETNDTLVNAYIKKCFVVT